MTFKNPGVVLLDKRGQVSSFRALQELQRKIGATKAGHAGTLDPGATGLLVCLLNSATRLAKYAESGTKRYIGQMRFGISTTTDDIDGDVIFKSDQALPTQSDILSVLPNFIGKIAQVPPQVSAVKIDGIRSYLRARKGEVVNIEPRQIEIYSLETRELELGLFEFDLSCSKGTYVRSIVRDLGEIFGCGGVLEQLRRIESLPFSINQAKTLEEIDTSDILPVDKVLGSFAKLELSSQEVGYFVSGRKDKISEIASSKLQEIDARCAVYYRGDVPHEILGVVERSDHTWQIAVNLKWEDRCHH